MTAARFRAALRRATLRRQRRQRRPDFSLLDRWSWLFPRVVAVVATSLAGAASSGPTSAAPVPASEAPSFSPSTESEPIAVIISKSRILLDDDPTPLVLLPAREELVEGGADARYKRSGRGDMFLVPLAEAIERKQEARGGGDRGLEAVVIADRSTPYRLLLEVLFTLGQSKVGKYHLMVTGRKK